jgi:hypothetical protein
MKLYDAGLGNPAWTVTKGTNFRGEYDPGSKIQYQEGDIVRRGGALWVSLTNQFTDDSSLRPLDTSNWQLQIAAQNFRGLGEQIKIIIYMIWSILEELCTMQVLLIIVHLKIFQEITDKGIDYWTIVLVGDQNAALTVLGDFNI